MSSKIRKIAGKMEPRDLIIALVAVLLTIGPHIYFTVIGAKALENESRLSKCSDATGTPTLATWLLVYGSVNLGPYILILALLISMLVTVVVSPMIVVTFVLLWALVVLVLSIFLFNLAWVIVGAVQLTSEGAADKCKAEEPVVYYSTIAAIAYGSLCIVLPFLLPIGFSS